MNLAFSRSRPGLVSVTFRQLSPLAIADLVQKAGLEGIEWGGDIHVPHGDVSRAREVRQITESHDLKVAAYGSYYRVGHSEKDGLPFERVLASAVELGAPLIRVWAGHREPHEADDAYWGQIADDAHRIAELAEAAGVAIAFEFHSGSLAATPHAVLRLLQQVGHPNLRTLWQPEVLPGGASGENNIAANANGLKELLASVENIHVYHWVQSPDEEHQRRPLSKGTAAWREYLACLAQSGRAHWLLLEFVRDDSPDAFLEDAATLRRWLKNDETD